MNELKDGFEQSVLPPSVLADMFPHHLVMADKPAAKSGTKATEIPEKAAPVAPKPETPEAAMPEASVSTIPAEEPVKTAPTVMGGFARRVLVIVHEPEAVHCSEANFELLTKIIGAIKFTVNDIALVNTARYSGDYFTIAETYPPAVAIFFGVEPASKGIPMRFPHFQVQPWGQTTFLYSPSLSELNGSSAEQTEMKKSLWTALRKIFVSQ